MPRFSPCDFPLDSNLLVDLANHWLHSWFRLKACPFPCSIFDHGCSAVPFSFPVSFLSQLQLGARAGFVRYCRGVSLAPILVPVFQLQGSRSANVERLWQDWHIRTLRFDLLNLLCLRQTQVSSHPPSLFSTVFLGSFRVLWLIVVWYILYGCYVYRIGLPGFSRSWISLRFLLRHLAPPMDSCFVILGHLSPWFTNFGERSPSPLCWLCSYVARIRCAFAHVGFVSATLDPSNVMYERPDWKFSPVSPQFRLLVFRSALQVSFLPPVSSPSRVNSFYGSYLLDNRLKPTLIPIGFWFNSECNTLRLLDVNQARLLSGPQLLVFGPGCVVQSVVINMDSLFSFTHYVALGLRFNGVSAFVVHSELYFGGHGVVITVIWLGSGWSVLFSYASIDLWYLYIICIDLWTPWLHSLAYSLGHRFMKCLYSPTMDYVPLQWDSSWIMVLVSLLYISLVFPCRYPSFHFLMNLFSIFSEDRFVLSLCWVTPFLLPSLVMVNMYAQFHVSLYPCSCWHLLIVQNVGVEVMGQNLLLARAVIPLIWSIPLLCWLCSYVVKHPEMGCFLLIMILFASFLIMWVTLSLSWGTPSLWLFQVMGSLYAQMLGQHCSSICWYLASLLNDWNEGKGQFPLVYEGVFSETSFFDLMTHFVSIIKLVLYSDAGFRINHCSHAQWPDSSVEAHGRLIQLCSSFMGKYPFLWIFLLRRPRFHMTVLVHLKCTTDDTVSFPSGCIPFIVASCNRYFVTAFEQHLRVLGPCRMALDLHLRMLGQVFTKKSKFDQHFSVLGPCLMALELHLWMLGKVYLLGRAGIGLPGYFEIQ